MTGARQVFEVARRDFTQRARSKAFLFTTLLTVGAIFALVPLIAADIQDPDPSRLGVLDAAPGLEERLVATGDALDVPVEIVEYTSEAQGSADLNTGAVDALLVGVSTLRYQERANPSLTAMVDAAVQQLMRERATAELGITPGEALAIIDPPGVTETVVEPPPEDSMARAIGAQFGAILMYMALLIFGQFIMLGVMEEKQSRVVEVVLSRVRASRLLTGKILGIGLLGLAQLVIIGAALLVAVNLVDIPEFDLPAVGTGVLLRTVAWFLLGFGMYAVLYGALGATVTRQEDSQGAALLPALLLIPGYFVSFTAIENPDGLAAVIGSLVPFSAPVVMPVRAASGAVPLWQVALSVVLVLATTALMIRIGGRVYRGAVLSIGAKVKIRDALRSAQR